MRWSAWFAWAIACAASSIVACSKPVATGWSGYVEGEYVYIAAPLGGALSTLAVRRGQSVTKGATLFRLEAEQERAVRDEATARLESARSQAANTDKGKRTDEIAMARAQLDQARAQASLAADALTRDVGLAAQGFVSAARLDESRSAVKQARARVAELDAALRVAQLPARSDERDAAAATAQAAQHALQETQWREDQKQQSAPTDAVVADTFFRVGEWVAAGQPVVALLPPSGTRALFFVPESELGAIALGEPVEIECDGCSAPIAAHITFIATQAEYTPPIIYSNSQRARLVFMAEARPDPKDGLRLKPGQPVDVRRGAVAVK